MRFSHKDELPPSEWVDTPEGTEKLAQLLEDSGEIYGFDLETDGLGYDIIDPAGDNKQAGDGLGAYLEVICLSFNGRRFGVDVGAACRDNLDIIAPSIFKTQHLAAGYNWIYDANVWDWNTRGRYPLNDLYADGMILWQHWDEDGEETDGRRDLKSRSRHYLGLKMSSFQKIIDEAGGIRAALETPRLMARTRSYCTRDAWAHLGMVTYGQQLAEKLVWVMECPICQEPAFMPDDQKVNWTCSTHGKVSGGEMLSIWDWHRRWDVPFLALLKRMQQEGLPIDSDYLLGYVDDMERSAQHALREFQRETSDALVALGGDPVSINPASPQQLQSYYFSSRDPEGKVIGLGYTPLEKTRTGAAATGVEVMSKLHAQHGAPGVHSLLVYRQLTKLISTYNKGLPARVWEHTGRVHSRLRPDTATSRLSSRNPNGTNLVATPTEFTVPPVKIPPSWEAAELAEMLDISLEDATRELELPVYRQREVSFHVRNGIRAPEGYTLVGADFAQLEVRLTAIESGDEVLQRVILEGMDMHSFTAAEVFGPQIPGLTYGTIVEAKKFKDVSWDFGGPNDREMLREAAYKINPQTGAVKPGAASYRLAGLYEMSQSKARLRQMMAFRLAGQGASEVNRGVQIAEACIDRIVAALKSRDKGHILQDISEVVEGKANPQTCAMLNQLLDQLLDLVDWADLEALMRLMGARDQELRNFRQSAKAAIFGIIYGIGAMGLAVQITKATGQRCTPDDAKPIIEAIKYRTYKGIGAMNDRLHQAVTTYGYVRTLMGRYRHPAGIFSGNKARVARGKRQAGNSPIQGLAANIMQRCMIKLDAHPKWKELDARLIMQVHDELLSLVPEEHGQEALNLKIHIMETGHGLVTPIPLLAEGGYDTMWGNIK